MERVAVVTGAASGIGRATALRLAGEGAAVAALDLDGDGLADTVDRAGTGARVRPVVVDVTEDEAVRQAAAEVAGAFAPVTTLVQCAGWDVYSLFADSEPAAWERAVAVNLLGVVRVAHAFLPALREAGGAGRIVHVASDAGRVGSSGEAVYAGAKGGVVAFTKSLARELARSGVTANVVCPGPTDTPLFASMPDRLQEALQRAIPMRRIATPEEIAHAIAFFAAPESGYLTGQVLSVSGGLTMAG